MIDDLASVAQSGVAALQRGDPEAARAAFEQVERAGRGTHQLRLLLAQACMLAADGAAAHRALDQVLTTEPTNLYALIMRGDLYRDADNPRAAVSWYHAALAQAPRAGALPPDLLDALRRVEGAVTQAGAVFQASLNDALADAGLGAPAPGTRLAEAMDILAGNAEVHLQQPTNFYYPGLAPRPFFDRETFDWVPGLEARTDAIRRELEQILADDGALSPYVKAEADRPAKQHALLGDPAWSAFHLFQDGQPLAEHSARCPETIVALADLPLPRIAGRSPTAMFSVLRAGTHIPPHHGMLNTRLICHLPLIVPRDCRLRVGNVVQVVQPGRMLIFDDSIQHEAWNDSDQTRVVLLFEIWRPDLDVAERQALTVLFEAIGQFTPGGTADQAGA